MNQLVLTSPNSLGLESTQKKIQTLKVELYKAFGNNQLEIYYQPQVSTDGIILAAEALLRWQHPIKGYISPMEFIPIAEESLLIIEITDWIIESICAQLRKWKDKGLEVIPISINLSPIRLMHGGLPKFIEQQLFKYKLDPALIEVELTESHYLVNTKFVIDDLDRLKELGIKIALDDFGTGYTSLEYIKFLNADKLKIDQTFIKNMNIENKKDTTIVSSVFFLSKGLEMKVVAEGVEKYEQLVFLKEKGCEYIQGYLFSKPVPVDSFEKLLRVGYLMPLIRESM